MEPMESNDKSSSGNAIISNTAATDSSDENDTDEREGSCMEDDNDDCIQVAMSNEGSCDTANTYNSHSCCPICLGNDAQQMVKGPCGHEFCKSCLERVLTVPTHSYDSNHFSSSWDEALIEDSYLQAPTLGRCPICRSPISLFQLIEAFSSATIATTVANKNNSNSNPFAFPKNYDILHSKIKGMVFVKTRCQVGNESIHFPPPPATATSSENMEPPGGSFLMEKPYLNLENIPNYNKKDWVLDDNTFLWNYKIYFDENCHFHDKTNTFHGSITWGKQQFPTDKGEAKFPCQRRLRGSQQWDLILQFSPDFRFVTRGICVAQKQICNNPSCHRYNCKFPLDGRWKVTWPEKCNRWDSTIVVHGNKFRYRDHRHEIIFVENVPTILWESNSDYEQSCLVGLTSKHGPAIGKTLEWEEDIPRNCHMIWTRESISNNTNNEAASQVLEVFHYGSDHSEKKQYLRLMPNSDGHLLERTIPIATHNPESIWGNTLCQGFTVGLASYHFMQNEESGAYISYEHERVAQWPPLDNGMTVPGRMWFTNCNFNIETRTFSGSIDWKGTLNTTWQGNRLWRYEMVFAEKYTCIVKGKVHCIPLGSNEERDMSVFGEDLLYLNPAVIANIQSEVGTDDNLAEAERSLVSLSRSICEEMERVGTSTRAVAMMQYALRMASDRSISYPSLGEEDISDL